MIMHLLEYFPSTEHMSLADYAIKAYQCVDSCSQTVYMNLALDGPDEEEHDQHPARYTKTNEIGIYFGN